MGVAKQLQAVVTVVVPSIIDEKPCPLSDCASQRTHVHNHRPEIKCLDKLPIKPCVPEQAAMSAFNGHQHTTLDTKLCNLECIDCDFVCQSQSAPILSRAPWSSAWVFLAPYFWEAGATV